MTALVIAEHDNGSIKGATLNTVANAAHAPSKIAGVGNVIHADAEGLAHGLAESVAAQVLAIAGGKNVAPQPGIAAGAWGAIQPELVSALG